MPTLVEQKGHLHRLESELRNQARKLVHVQMQRMPNPARLTQLQASVDQIKKDITNLKADIAKQESE